MIPVAEFNGIMRDLYLARIIKKHAEGDVSTLRVAFADMVVSFATDDATSNCTVEVSPNIDINVFGARIEEILDCAGIAPEGAMNVLKWSSRVSDFGTFETVRSSLCDKIAKIDRNETVGVMKIRRRGIETGHAKVRLLRDEDSLQVVVRHTSCQGLKAVWKSVVHKMCPPLPKK